MAEKVGLNCITKYAIIVVSLILAVVVAISLFLEITNDKSYDINKILELVKLGIFLTLCVLSCWGAYSENSCLCYIALSFCVMCLIFAIWSLVYCFTGPSDKCDTVEYIKRSVPIVLSVVMIVLVFLFIRSIE